MKQFLLNKLIAQYGDRFHHGDVLFHYEEDTNPDALTNAWLENRTSYIYKVCILVSIDANKCDWAHIAIGYQRAEGAEPVLLGTFFFPQGENDDINRVLYRAMKMLEHVHPVFYPILNKEENELYF